MDVFQHLADGEALKGLLSQAAQADITAWCAKVTLVWFFMGRKVGERFRGITKKLEGGIGDVRKEFADHFAKMSDGLNAVAKEMKDLKEAVSADLTAHKKRLDTLETGFSELKTEVQSLKQKP